MPDLQALPHDLGDSISCHPFEDDKEAAGPSQATLVTRRPEAAPLTKPARIVSSASVTYPQLGSEELPASSQDDSGFNSDPEDVDDETSRLIRKTCAHNLRERECIVNEDITKHKLCRFMSAPNPSSNRRINFEQHDKSLVASRAADVPQHTARSELFTWDKLQQRQRQKNG
ncbi:MAG: hypothetical protein Q9216_002002 [Gyalolechia sp. 2 TL-2023]